MQTVQHQKKNQAGLSYLEVIIATAILAISLVPAMEALSAAQKGSQVNSELQRQYYILLEKYELTLSQPFSALDEEAETLADKDTPSAVYSDDSSKQHQSLVFIQRFDADNADGDDDPFTGGDANILWVKVSVKGTAMSKETLVSSY